ncbi:MAG: hypothetical protein ACR2QC_04860 [Gammaproteobacteria bacterium]
MYNYRLRRIDSCLRRNGTGGRRKLRGGRNSAGGGAWNPLAAAESGGGAEKSAPCRRIGRKNYSGGVFLRIICTFFASGRKNGTCGGDSVL